MIEERTPTEGSPQSVSTRLPSACASGNAWATSERVMELETKNAHLQQLVAELLIKNQQLRELHRRSGTAIEDPPTGSM